MKSCSRRSFLGRVLQAAGLVGLTLRSSQVEADEMDAAATLAAKAVNFLRGRHASDGSWSGDRNEPEITALVVTAMLRSGHVTPEDPAVTQGLTPTASWRATRTSSPPTGCWPWPPPQQRNNLSGGAHVDISLSRRSVMA